MVNPDPITETHAPNPSGWFEFRVSLASMDPDDVLSVVLPAQLSGATVSQLLAYTFPPGEVEQRAVASMFDLRANPDLPEIYAVFLDAFDEWRKGRCTLSFSGGDGTDLELSALVLRKLEFSGAGGWESANDNLHSPASGALPQNCHSEERSDEESGEVSPDHEGGGTSPAPQVLRFAQDDGSRITGFPRPGVENISAGERQSPYPRLQIQMNQQYRAVEYASQTGFWGTKEELLEWLQSLTFLYFLDKHEVEVPAPLPYGSGPGLTATAAALQSKDLISCSADTQKFVITEEGRGFISRLVKETESYIDLYDHFKDTGFDLDRDALDRDTLQPETLDVDTIEFDTGRGVDLRVQVFMTEGLDPVRTVFLLRLYDGTFDGFVATWEGLIEDESFFDGILEPVVNRCEVDEAAIGQIVESGYGFLEERSERARELESQQEIIGRVWA